MKEQVGLRRAYSLNHGYKISSPKTTAQLLQEEIKPFSTVRKYAQYLMDLDPFAEAEGLLEKNDLALLSQFFEIYGFNTKPCLFYLLADYFIEEQHLLALDVFLTMPTSIEFFLAVHELLTKKELHNLGWQQLPILRGQAELTPLLLTIYDKSNLMVIELFLKHWQKSLTPQELQHLFRASLSHNRDYHLAEYLLEHYSQHLSVTELSLIIPHLLRAQPEKPLQIRFKRGQLLVDGPLAVFEKLAQFFPTMIEEKTCFSKRWNLDCVSFENKALLIYGALNFFDTKTHPHFKAYLLVQRAILYNQFQLENLPAHTRAPKREIIRVLSDLAAAIKTGVDKAVPKIVEDFPLERRALLKAGGCKSINSNLEAELLGFPEATKELFGDGVRLSPIKSIRA